MATQKKFYRTLQDLWNDIEAGVKVYWSNESYQVLVQNDPVSCKDMFSHKDGKMLRVTCMSNWFGSRLDKNEITSCYRKVG